MQATSSCSGANPLSELISDDVFHRLAEHNLLNEKSIRDYQIRKRFREMRRSAIATNDAIEMLQDDYPYLQFDTIRKIVYGLNRRQ
ncbi:MAG: hypothetical protein ACOCTG_06365 [Bacteroidota bacterium]